ncbi:MAG: hypothetical protein DRN49_03945 [Thaumarchaeota archaeon]|nr:MAG: hypothetical protein DRN49_03945 [Nitrososphaerota archaeon]
MRLYAGICGSFPRPPELRKAINEFREGKIGRGEFEERYRSSFRMVVRLQEDSGLNLLTSGLLLWDDLLRPFAENLAGIRLGRLLRFFDNNFYYRCPVIVDQIKWMRPIILDEVRSLSEVTSKAVKAIIPGPYTFLKLSEDRFYGSRDRLADDLIQVLEREIESLSDLADFIQIDEPSLVDPELGEDDRKWGVEVVNRLLEAVSVPRDRFLVATYFNLDPGSYSILLGVEAGLHLDLSSARDAEDVLRREGYSGDLLSLGVVDSRSIFPEKPEDITGRVEKILEGVSVNALIISTSSWLDYIPFENAVEKLKILGEVLRRLEAGSR